MSSNFLYLQSEWPSIFEKVSKAEQTVVTEPVTSGFYCRLALEEAVKIIYSKHYLELPYNSTIYSLMSQQEFIAVVDAQYLAGVDKYTRVIGNNASHGKKVSKEEALISIKYLFAFLKWFALQYNDRVPEVPGAFDESIIPKAGEQQRKVKELQAEIDRLKAIAEEAEKKRLIDLEKLRNELQGDSNKFRLYHQTREIQLDVLKHNSIKRDFSQITPEFTEAQTRLHLIDAALKEAGWEDLRKDKDMEYPVTGMPKNRDNPKGNGFVDYVLWDDNGLPLAVVEAKRTSKEANLGKHQASLYANCLEEMHGQRPIIFYTNGYETHIWEDTFYVPRRTYGFYTKEELQWLIQKRKTRKDIRSFVVNQEIAGRWYQEEAIKRVTEAFARTSPQTKLMTGAYTSALLVMATGSGKTRTAAALTELLFKGNWIRRVLFLADRNALVTQAKNNFNEYLPDYSAIDLTKDKEDDTARLVFSTYPSMMNRIDSAKQDGKRIYGIGHFDLIIVDEAHRSVYNKYKAIFDYFDCLIVGLTATPKEDIDHHTFNLFGCPEGDPTFAYELKKAVEDKYLVPYRRFGLTTRFLREGIKYKELSDKEKEEYEKTFDDEENGLVEEIGNTALTRWLFNQQTVDEVLRSVQTHGLRIEGGDKIGRTIIFAANQKHADYIIKRYYALYPEHGGGYIELVYNGVSHVQNIIDKFCEKDKENMPQIAVSVDMMDTGIDAPRVLNLVFFKAVKSYSKFWQMIGRGTRLSENIFGPGDDKKEFFIFDTCGNFEYFDVNPEGVNTNSHKPITQQIFESRLQLSQLLSQNRNEDNLELASGHLDMLHQQIATLAPDRFEVNLKKRFVDQFNKRSKWNNLSNDDIHLIQEHLSGLPVPESVKETTRRFDLLTLKMQIANLLSLSKEASYAEKLIDIASELSQKYSVPDVSKHKELIEQMKTEEFYVKITQKKLEQVRKEIRDLLQYLDKSESVSVYATFEDDGLMIVEGDVSYGKTLESYRNRVEKFIRDNKDHITIRKLNTNIPITKAEIAELERILFDGDVRGTKEDFIKNVGEEPLGKFIRSIVGLELTAVQKVFSEFLGSNSFSADQITFLNTIISYLTKNGTIDKAMLVESPFNDRHDQGIFGVFEDEAQVEKVISIIDRINENAELVG
ncbi:MAG: Type site-specific deoxyribonuclease [Cytophagaceae bacterium]|jgi:type I restriction enzyme R subunit|nr:Type site-specific deoxyribonuclease [Cytophagaceae bacterium]